MLHRKPMNGCAIIAKEREHRPVPKDVVSGWTKEAISKSRFWFNKPEAYKDQGGAEFQAAGIQPYIEDLKRGTNTKIEPKDLFEMAFCILPEMVDFASGQGRSDFATAGVAALRRGLQRRENAGLEQKMPFLDGYYYCPLSRLCIFFNVSGSVEPIISMTCVRSSPCRGWADSANSTSRMSQIALTSFSGVIGFSMV